MNSPNTKSITIQDSSDIHKAEHVKGNPESEMRPNKIPRHSVGKLLEIDYVVEGEVKHPAHYVFAMSGRLVKRKLIIPLKFSFEIIYIL